VLGKGKKAEELMKAVYNDLEKLHHRHVITNLKLL
jgi:hypothetical protein